MAKKQIVKQIYIYAICVGIWGVVKIASPQLTLPQWEWKEVATFQSFKTDWETRETAPKLTDEELKVRWQDKREIAIMGERRGGWQNLTLMLR